MCEKNYRLLSNFTQFEDIISIYLYILSLSITKKNDGSPIRKRASAYLGHNNRAS